MKSVSGKSAFISIFIIFIICGCWEQFDYITVTNSGQVKFISKIIIRDEAKEFSSADIDEFSSGFLIDLEKAGWTVDKKWISKQRPFKIEVNGSGNLDKVATETAFYKITRVSGIEYRIRFIPAESEGQKSSRTVTFKKLNLKNSAYFYDSNGVPVETISNVQTDKQYVIAFDQKVRSKLIKQAQERGNLSDDERAKKSIETYISSYLDKNIKALIEYDSHMYESIIQKVREVPKQLQDEAFEQYLLEKINKLKEYEQNKLIEGTIFDNKNTKHFFLQQAFGGGASPYDILYPGMTFEVMEIRDSSGSGNIPCQVCNKLAFVRLFYQNPQNAPYLDFTKIIKIKSAIIKIYLSKWSHENTGWVDYKLLHFQPTDHKRELFKIGPKQIEKKAHEIFASRHTYAQKKQAVETYLNQYPNDTYTDEARAKITDIQNQIDDDAFSHALQNSDDRSKIQKLENYLQIFPDGRHVDEAKNEIEKIRQKWSKEKEKIKQQRDDGFFKRALIEPDDLHRKNRLADYLSRFPNGSHIVEANKKIEEINVKLDDKAFNKAFHNKSDRSRLSALEKYMQVHPNGRYVAKASMEISRIKSKMDDDAFAKAMRTRPKSRFKALEKYLDRFPDGIHREEANKQLGQN